MIDSHAHLQSVAFERDLPDVLARAVEAGVTRILVPGWDLASSRAAVALCHPGEQAAGPVVVVAWPIRPAIVAAVGIHPHAASSADDAAWSGVAALAEEARVVAVGETGLDYDRMFAPRDVQLANLRRHLGLARAVAKPLVLHCRSPKGRRDAQDELLRELEDAGVGGASWTAIFADRPPAVLHSYSGPVDYAEQALALGLAISFSGLVFRPGEASSVEVARLVPGDRLLVETDAPYLAPPGASRRNEPASVRATVGWLAAQRSSEAASLGRDLVSSFERIFRTPQTGATSTGSS